MLIQTFGLRCTFLCLDTKERYQEIKAAFGSLSFLFQLGAELASLRQSPLRYTAGGSLDGENEAAVWLPQSSEAFARFSIVCCAYLFFVDSYIRIPIYTFSI